MPVFLTQQQERIKTPGDGRVKPVPLLIKDSLDLGQTLGQQQKMGVLVLCDTGLVPSLSGPLLLHL